MSIATVSGTKPRARGASSSDATCLDSWLRAVSTGHPRPRRQRVQRLHETSAEQSPRAVPFPTRPPERVKLDHKRGHFRGVENGGDLGSDRAPWYRLTCQPSLSLVWSRLPEAATSR